MISKLWARATNRGPPIKTTIYFDGLCHLCSREINHYRKMAGADRLEFKDITATGFDAAGEGLDPKEIHRVMHVRAANGELRRGVDAFVEIWSNLDKMRWLVPWARRAPLKQVLNLGYIAFAAIRPLLPRRACPDDACAIN